LNFTQRDPACGSRSLESHGTSGRVSARSLALPLAMTILALGSCKKSLELNKTGYIVGPTNDILQIKPENRESVPAAVFNATVLIVTRVGGDRVKYCTGSLVDGESGASALRVLTNHHCFADIERSASGSETARGTVIPEACAATDTYFGFAPKLGISPVKVGCQPGSFRSDPKLDLAIYTLARALPPDFRPLQLAPESRVTVGRRAMIVHYPEVKETLATLPGQPVQLPTASLTLNDCQLLGTFPEREWSIDPSVPYSLRHSCDLVQGSSGSALVDVEAQLILGVNWGGIKLKFDERERIDNVATRAEFVASFLAGREIPEPKPAMDSGKSAEALAGYPEEREKQQASGSISRLTKRCGVIASRDHASETTTPGTSPLWLLALPLLFSLNSVAGRRSLLIAATLFAALPFTERLAASPVGATAATADALVDQASADAALSFARTNLLNSLFVAEYAAVVASPRMNADGTRSSPGDRLLLISDVQPLWQRAAFALASARHRGQRVQDSVLRKALVEQDEGGMLAAMPKRERAVWKLRNTSRPAADQLLAQIDRTFADDARGHWVKFARDFTRDAKGISCPVDAATVTRFVERHRASTRSGETLSPQQLTALLPRSDVPAIRCLMLALVNARDATDPAPLIMALRQTNHPAASDETLLVLLAVRLFEQDNFPESLRVILELRDRDPSYRLAYDTVQRVYSLRQRGKGEVALKGL